MIKHLQNFTFAAVLTIAPSWAHAVPTAIFDNLAQVPTNNESVNDFGPLYASFSTGASSATLDSLALILDGGLVVGSIDIGLYANNPSGPAPGALLNTLATIADSDIASGISTVLVQSLTDALNANTRYWIGLSTANNSSTGWYYTPSDQGTGVAGEFWADSTGVFSNTDFPFLLQVNVNINAASVPEPSPLALLALGGVIAVPSIRKRLTDPRA